MSTPRAPELKSVTLQVVGAPAAALGLSASHTFSVRGGTLGRAADNDWVIDHPYVSRYQANIVFADGIFCIELNPLASADMFILATSVQARAEERYPLANGEQIMIDELRIRAEVSSSEAVSSSPDETPDPLDDPRPFGYRDAPFTQPGRLPPRPADSARPSDIEYTPERPTPDRRDNDDPRATPTYNPLPSEHVPLQIGKPRVDIPEDFWKDTPRTTGESPADRPTDGPTLRGRSPTLDPPPAHTESDLMPFLAGAGIDATDVTPEVLSTLGAILRVTVDGVVEILRARNEIRREFRVASTIAQGHELNPLKFSADAKDALYNMLVKRNTAYLAAVPAFEEAFDDLKSHQMAMLRGMRAGYEHALSRFNPQKLEQRFESQAKMVAFKGLGGRSKLWEQYCAWFAEATEDDEDCFRRFFGNEFAEAYEEELRRQVDARKLKRSKE